MTRETENNYFEQEEFTIDAKVGDILQLNNHLI